MGEETQLKIKLPLQPEVIFVKNNKNELVSVTWPQWIAFRWHKMSEGQRRSYGGLNQFSDQLDANVAMVGYFVKADGSIKDTAGAKKLIVKMANVDDLTQHPVRVEKTLINDSKISLHSESKRVPDAGSMDLDAVTGNLFGEKPPTELDEKHREKGIVARDRSTDAKRPRIDEKAGGQHPAAVDKQPDANLEYADAEGTIKKEILDIETLVLKHHIDNTCPVLRDPENPTENLLVASEGSEDRLAQKIRYNARMLAGLKNNEQETHRIDNNGERNYFVKEYQINQWWEMNKVFAEMSKEQAKKIMKFQIQYDALSLLQGNNLALHLDELTYASIDLTDETRLRGMSVFAEQYIPVGTVIGPYAGELYQSTESLIAKSGISDPQDMYNYAWKTSSVKGQERWVSAFSSLVNTATLPEKASIGVNNLAAIKIGNNLIFYVASKDIRAHDELLVNYGDEY